jgi:dihydrofolate synthase/folylpolyglutamate synthase
LKTERSGGAPAVSATLDDWLAYIERQHPRTIEMGLDRVRAVRAAMGLAPRFPIITVGGTNGKGSTCAMLEAMLHAAGYRVGCYTSPHLLAYNERVRIDTAAAGDRELVESFAAVAAARGDIPLTYFEFGTLGAVWLFERLSVDVAVLEVGLGGRLDAVNAFDADCAVITSIGLDHMEYLGPTRESIAFEKAGIFRPRRPAVIAEADVPEPMRAYALAVDAVMLRIGEHFRVEPEGVQWRYVGPGGVRGGLPHPALRGRYQLSNAAAAITALDTLRDRLPVSAGAIREGLLTATVPGRFQVLPGRPVTILDVAHNPHAAERLAAALDEMDHDGTTHAVLGMLADKDIAGVVRAVKAHVDRWYLAPLPGPRGAQLDLLHHALDDAQVLDPVRDFGSVTDAVRAAQDAADAGDRILVFGSFLTVSEALHALRRDSIESAASR